MSPVRGLVIALLALLAAVLAPNANAASGLMLGFNTVPTAGTWLGRASAEGADVIRVGGGWEGVAPAHRPPGFDPANPASPGYDWSSVDSQVRTLSAQGFQVLLVITGAPSWAQAPGQPSGNQPGTWKPDPRQFALFAQAAARRYDGTFPDPRNPGAVLPRVRYWQAWNEPNLDRYLTPQWTATRHGYVAASPVIYRGLLNAFYGAVKGVSSSNFVVTAGMAPYGNPPGISLPGIGNRVPPVQFDQVLFSRPVHLDAVAQNIYSIHGPMWHAYNAGDVAVPDLDKINRALNASQHAGHILPRGPKSIWVTELGWDSRPPSAQGVPIAEQARWYEQAFYVLWRQNVDLVLLLQVVDLPPPIPPASTAAQSGLYYSTGGAKPAATAFRFPFVADRLGRDTVRAWGRTPVGGRVVIERLRGKRWVALATLTAGSRQVFVRTIALRGRAELRARVSGQTSLTWTQSA